MDAGHRVARAALESARGMFLDNVAGISLDEALDSAGGFRSVLGLLKHTTAWTAVYHSFAFDDVPTSWDETDWPRGLRERIDPSAGYFGEVLAWFEHASHAWLLSIDQPIDLDDPRPMHWGDAWPLREIVSYVSAHWAYHAGEINLILAVRRGEAWEYGEHVEENHISTIGHSVRRPWITDDEARRFEGDMRNAAIPPGPAD